MAQQTQIPSTPPNNRFLQFITYLLQFIGALLILAVFISGFYAILVKNEVLLSLISFSVAFAGIPLSILQINKNVFSLIIKKKKITAQVIGILLLIVSLTLNWHFLSSKSFNLPQVSPTSISSPNSSLTQSPSSAAIASSSSSLIPEGKEPAVDDTLSNNSQGYRWDEGLNAQKTGRCDFSQGLYYLISAPAGNSDIGCNTEGTSPHDV